MEETKSGRYSALGHGSAARTQPPEGQDFSEVTITESHMFGSVFEREDLCRKLIGLILEREFTEVLSVVKERELSPDLRDHGIRLDIWARDADGVLYHLEMQTTEDADLALRSRYYLSAGDRDRLRKGVRYGELRGTYVIFICLYDPFGDGLVRYTFLPTCQENGRLLPDGTVRIFLNPRAVGKGDTGSLAAFLRYACGDENVSDPFVREVDDEVRRLRADPRWARQRMTLEMLLDETAARVERETAARVERETAARVERETAERVERETAARVERETTERVEREAAARVEREVIARMERALRDGGPEALAALLRELQSQQVNGCEQSKVGEAEDDA